MSSLAVAQVTAKDASPERWIVFLHGILGSGANWRTFARRIVATCPRWGALLVDLRLHGESQDFAPPHTVESAARDVLEALGEIAPCTRAVLGHSFGGKVGIELARQIAASPHGALDHLFVVDSTPGARSDYRGSAGVRQIVELLRELPEEFPDRNAFTAWAEQRGVNRPTAMWLAMNIRPVAGDPTSPQRFRFRIDVLAVRAMMEDYFAQDLWTVIEHPPGQMKTHILAGTNSDVLDVADLEHARRCPRTDVHVIPNAGHWVHVDAPDALHDIVSLALNAL